MPRYVEGHLVGTGRRFGVVVSRFNDTITERLLEGALDCLVRHGVKDEDILVARVPGAFEIPVAAKVMVERGGQDAVLCLGAVIRGQTPHFDHVAGQAAAGIARLASDSGIPVIFGVLTTDSTEQAMERSGIKSGNKGHEAAMAALEMVSLLDQLRRIER